jgi:hypothetical protein
VQQLSAGETCSGGGVEIVSLGYLTVEGKVKELEGQPITIAIGYAVVCTGRDGQDGAPGEQGPAGKDGAPGTNTIVYMTAPGQTRTADAGGVAGVTATNEVSSRVAKLRIVARKGHTIRHLRVALEGRAVRIKRTGKRTWIARINLSGLPRGTYVAHVTARVNGRTVRHAHLYRVLYGNPKGGTATGANSSPFVRL